MLVDLKHDDAGITEDKSPLHSYTAVTYVGF